MNTARFGVIGLGVWGERHVRTYRQHPQADLVAICDVNQERLDAVGSRYGVEGRHTDYRELLARDDVDAVSIATPDFAHADIVVQAAGQGKHILIEKPMATTMEDCERIREALQGRPVKFMVDFHNRWSPAVADIKRRLDGGELGEPRMIYYRLSDNISVPTEMLSWAGRSTVSWFLASHCLDTMRWLLDDEVQKVYTVSRSGLLTGMGIDTPDFYQSVLEFANGVTALLENCWIIARSCPRLFDLKLELVGNKGAAFLDGAPESLNVFTDEGATNPDTFVCPEVHDRVVGLGIESIQYFAECMANDTQPMVGFEDGYRATRIILAMEESVRTGKPVELS